MEELKIPEERNDPKQASGWPFSKRVDRGVETT